MSHLVGITQLLHRGGAVAAADDGDGIRLGQGLGHGLSALGKGGELKHAHRAVPDHSAGVGHGGAVQLHSLGTDVQALPAIGDLASLYHLAVGVGRKLVGAHGVYGEQELDALVLGLLEHLKGVVHPVGLQQGAADLAALGRGEGIGHAAADDDGVGDLQQVVNDPDLGGHLGAAQNGHQRALGVGQRTANDLQLLLDQESGHRRQVVGHTSSRGVSTVDRAEGVGHIDLSQRGHSLGQGGVVLGLALFKAGVLQQEDLTGLEGCGLGLGVRAYHISSHDDLPAQQLAQAGGHRLQGELRQGLLPLLLREGGGILALLGLLLHIGLKGGVGLAHVRTGDNSGIVIQQILDGGQGGTDALVIRDNAAAILGHGDIEVAAEQDLLAGDVDILDCFLVVVHGGENSSLHKTLDNHDMTAYVWGRSCAAKAAKEASEVEMTGGGGGSPALAFQRSAISPVPERPGKPCWRSAS